MSTQPLNRRTVVRGLGTVLALPWLESMSSGKLQAATKNPPKRIAFIYTPNGAIMPTWTPEGEGKDYKLSKTSANAAHPKTSSIETGNTKMVL